MTPLLEQPQAYRQSLIAAFDSCPRRALFAMLDRRRTPSPLAARGALFHRWQYQAVEEMRAHGEASMPVEQGIELLAEVLCQADVSAEEVVPLTMSEMRWLRVLVVKWCLRMELSIERIVGVERRLYAELTLPTGGTRTLTGQLDILQAGPESDGATSIDAKTGFARPKQTHGGEDSGSGLTELGWVQSLIYALLVFANYPVVQRFTFREWHVFWGESREVTVWRWEVERLMDVLAAQVALLDQAVAEGPESPRWTESAGPHCSLCAMPRHCPIKDQVGIPANADEARRMAQEWIVAGEVRRERVPFLKGWVEQFGPIEVPHSRGRRYVGWDLLPDGKRTFGVFEPRPMPQSTEDPAFDRMLEESLRERGVLVE